jgi:hypothetical protein
LQREEQKITAEQQRLAQDQDRIRRNLRETPRDVPLYKTYIDKLTAQESVLEALGTRLREVQAKATQARETYEKFITTIDS